MEMNRIEKGLRGWSDKEAMLKDLFGSAIQNTQYMAKAKLVTYREINDRIANNLTSEEKLMRGILRGEIKVLERQLYPSLLVRILRNIGRKLSVNQKEPVVKQTAATLTIEPVKQRIQPAVQRQATKLLKANTQTTGLLQKRHQRQGKSKSISR